MKMYKFVGGENYVAGLPQADIPEAEWETYPEDLRETALANKLYEVATVKAPKPAPADEPAKE